MAGRSRWGVTPRHSVETACAQRGPAAVIAGCVALLTVDADAAADADADAAADAGLVADAGFAADADPALVAALGGPRGPDYLDAPSGQRYWLRVWAARGLLWAPWEPEAATTAVIAALADDHWRVREMAAKVVARHRVDEAQPAVAHLLTDEVERVRTAAARAVRLLAPLTP
jgi:hypothetical protein